MTTFRVWDPINGSEQSGDTIEAFDELAAAEEYAGQDTDGEIDGIYSHWHDVNVRDADGVVHRLEVMVEYDPTFYARRKSPTG